MVASLLSDTGLSALAASREETGPKLLRDEALVFWYSEGYAGPAGEDRGGPSIERMFDRELYP
nr:hypothetical protein [Tanacetum cinerariifolium]